MKHYLLNTICLLCISISVWSQNKLLRAASKLEKAEQYEAAFAKYVSAMHQNNTKETTRSSITRTSKKIIDKWLSDYFILSNTEDYEKVFQLIDQFENHKKQLEYFNISSTIPARYEKDFDEKKDSILEYWYNKALYYINENRYELAESYFEKISKIEANYKDIAAKKLELKTTSVFGDAITAYKQNKITEAWKLFDKLPSTHPNYTEVSNYKAKIIKDYALSMSVITAKPDTQDKESQLRNSIIASISQLNNPFIVLVDRNNMQAVIEEQKLGLSGIIDETTAAQVGKLIGAKTVLLIKVISDDFVEGVQQEFTKTAYQSQRVNGLTQYQPVNYKEYLKTDTLITTLQFQLINTETGQILLADVVEHAQKEIVNYATYNGNYQNLYPAKDGLIYKSGKERETFFKLFETTKIQPKSLAEISILCQKSMSQKVANSIQSYFKERL